MSGLDVFGKDGGEAFDIVAEVVFLKDALAAIHGEVGAEAVVVDEGGECVDERGEIGWGDEQAFDAVANQFGDAGNCGGDAGNAHGQGFHEDDGKALGKAGQAEDVGLGVDGADAVLVDGAFEEDAVSEVDASRVGAEVGLIGAAAGEAKTDIAALVEELMKGVDEEVLAFGGG